MTNTIHEDLKLFMELALEFLEDEQTNPVVPPISPEKLYEKLDLELQDEPCVDEELKKSLREIVLNTPKTASKLFFNQLFGGRQSKAVLGDLLAVMLNNSMYTYKVAGPQVGIEKEIISNVVDMIGFPKDTASGTIATGGSMTNFMGMCMARDAVNADYRHHGFCEQLIAYSSRESHYSNAKNAAFLGIGRNNVRYIDSNEKGEINTDLLEKQIQEDVDNGLKPFFINATAGTTVLGVFDPIEECARIARKFGLWLHVDGAYSGGVIFSRRYKHLIRGIEKADSFSFNAHKMIGTPLTCSILLVRDKKYLYQSFDSSAEYLYQTDVDEYNLGKTSFQCGRRNDALKFWVLWKSVGTKGLEKIIDRLFELADYARNYIEKHPDYEMCGFGNSLSVCFNYKNIHAETLCTRLYEKAKTLVGYGHFKEKSFVRLILINSNLTEEDIDRFFAQVESEE